MKRYLFSLLFVPAFSYAQPSADTLSTFGLTFQPDHSFTASSLQGLNTLGDVRWQASNGEIVGKGTTGTSGGWLLLDKPYQDVGFHAQFKTSGNSEAALMFRTEKINDGYRGVMLSLKNGDVTPYSVVLDARGKEMSREKLRTAGGIMYRLAPPPDTSSRRLNYVPPRTTTPSDLPVRVPYTGFRENDWNEIEVFIETNVIRGFLNSGREIGGAVDGAAGTSGFGSIALFAGGNGEVRFKDIKYKDISVRVTPTENVSPRFKVQQISDMYYSWGADAGDYNKDGHIDIVSGPYIYFGPDFTRHKEIYPAVAVGPSKEFSRTHVQFTYDFNGDGWPDILNTPPAATLYINPKGESRRWTGYEALSSVQSESTDFVDIDGDGKPELVYAAQGAFRFAKPDPNDITAKWIEYNVSGPGYAMAHGIGTGDINGDGRLDILGAVGWWEQPATLQKDVTWKYHPVAFGRYANRANNIGGALMAVYDANGDGLNDVVCNLNVHGFGLAWFEQKRDAAGNISFVRHIISDDYSKKSAGDVTFSQAHGATFADVDNDGVKDFIVGKRFFTHLDNMYDPDSYGAPVIYWYRTVRDKKAPGGARFVPELIHNRSGAGSEITAIDLNKDGAVDIITATNRGTFIFWNTPAGRKAPSGPASKASTKK